MSKKVIIIGAGPAGLTAAYELLTKTDIIPVIYEKAGVVGGLSRTVTYEGNRVDIGGHRFFSKSDAVLAWWEQFLPLQGAPARDDLLLGRKIEFSSKPGAPDPEKVDEVMLIRSRKSSIFSHGKFFNYPLTFTMETFARLGFVRTLKIAFDYFKAQLFPLKQEKNLEDFFLNRFGKTLYLFFFKHYSRKLWGRSCKHIGAEWGRQRVKGVSIPVLLRHALRKYVLPQKFSFSNKKVETSLIEMFLYPKFGPGQLWDAVACAVRARGGQIYTEHIVEQVMVEDNKARAISVRHAMTGEKTVVQGDYIFSTMPMGDLICCCKDAGRTEEITRLAKSLSYRAIITVAFIVKELRIKDTTKINTVNGLIPENWIYLHDMSIRAGRLQIYNNWSPYLVKDANTVSIALEYFCGEDDRLWRKTDDEMAALAQAELQKIGMIDSGDVLCFKVVKETHAYPVYAGPGYEQFWRLREYVDRIENLFLAGRGGMHRYNNCDHSMLTAMRVVQNVIEGVTSKESIWEINTEQQYHETVSMPCQK